MQIPIYVTRETAGKTGSIEQNVYLVLLAYMIIYLNVVGWGIFGLYTLIDKVV